MNDKDLDKMFGAGKDCWESHEDFEDWLNEIKKMRISKPKREFFCPFCQQKGKIINARDVGERVTSFSFRCNTHNCMIKLPGKSTAKFARIYLFKIYDKINGGEKCILKK